MSYPNEKVLVVPTSVFHAAGRFQGFCGDVQVYWPRLLDGHVMEFRLRDEVEHQPQWKQLIPYILFLWRDEKGLRHVFRYTRGKGMGEGRLHLKHSVGVGGHISLEDAENAVEGMETDPEKVYLAGMMRERDEEVEIRTDIIDSKIIGLINDDESEVGRVHLGVVHVVEVARPEVFSREKDIIASGFVPLEELLADLTGFETWSQIALTALAKN